MNRRQRLLRIQLALLALLLTIWWFTQPPEEIRPPQASQTPSSQPTFETSGFNDSSVHWSSNFDMSNPKCVKLRDEIMKQKSEGSTMNVFQIGDCDKRLQYQ
ncbi:MAG: hypothetical protein AAF680_11925 [Pseudomonadota bacterium]